MYMSDGNRPIGGTFEDIGEALEPVKDEVGKAIEAGIQSVIPPAKQPTPRQKQQPFGFAQGKQKLEEQQKLTDARRKIKWWQDLEEAQRKIREEEKQKLLQRQQQEKQAKQEKVQVKEFEIFKKQKEVNPEIQAKGKAEIKRGVGG